MKKTPIYLPHRSHFNSSFLENERFIYEDGAPEAICRGNSKGEALKIERDEKGKPVPGSLESLAKNATFCRSVEEREELEAEIIASKYPDVEYDHRSGKFIHTIDEVFKFKQPRDSFVRQLDGSIVFKHEEIEAWIKKNEAEVKTRRG